MAEEIPPPEAEAAFEITERLLVALIREDQELIEQIRGDEDVSWWNVAWTLALLLRQVFEGNPQSLRIMADIFEEARLRDAIGG